MHALQATHATLCNTNSTAFFKSNSTFQFLPGIHFLENNEGNKPTTIENVQNITLIGNDTFINDTLEMPVPSSQIHCNGSGGLHFTAVHGLFIGNLMFSTCGAVLPWPFNGKFRAALAIGLTTPQKSIFDVTITRVVIQNSTGHGLYASNVLGNSVVSESTFIYNNYNGSQEYYGGHIRMSYLNCLEMQVTPPSQSNHHISCMVVIQILTGIMEQTQHWLV